MHNALVEERYGTNKKFWEELIAYFPLIRIENDASNNSSLPRERVYQAIALQR
jgi:hypothetical protein